MSQLELGEHGVYAVGQGDVTRHDINRSAQNHLHQVSRSKPIHVPTGRLTTKAFFSTLAPIQAVHTIGVYKYEIATGAEKLIAVSTAAASFTDGGDIIALGNQKLTFRGATEHPEEPMLAQVAISEPDQGSVDLKIARLQYNPEYVRRKHDVLLERFRRHRDARSTRQARQSHGEKW